MKKPQLPGKIRLHGELYQATVLQLVEADEDGTPRVLRVLRDHEAVHLEGGERFFVVFATDAIHTPKPRN